MRRLVVTAVCITIGVVSILTPARAQRQTGDQAARIARTLFEKTVEAQLAHRRSQCLSAIGSPAFCDCLNGRLPLAVDLQQYVTVTTTPNRDGRALSFPPDAQRLADLIWETRHQCVAAVFARLK